MNAPTPTQVEDLTFAARVDQNLAAILDAHKAMDTIVGTPDADGPVYDSTINGQSQRLNDLSFRLNDRLQNLVRRLGGQLL